MNDIEIFVRLFFCSWCNINNNMIKNMFEQNLILFKNINQKYVFFGNICMINCKKDDEI